jgi:hypothetical protein
MNISQRSIKNPANSLGMIGLFLFFALILRVYHLDTSPLRGDEAFTVRYWAAGLEESLALARVEPHPLFIFLTFGAWKELAGESEWAMRYLPALFNLLGVAGGYQIGLRLFKNNRIGLIVALLWAVNPFLIWHAQDVRNYAIWAAVSVCSLAAAIRAADEKSQRAWWLYVVWELIALNTFFFQIFFALLTGLYVITRRCNPRELLQAGGVILIGVLAWLWQAYQLATSGYRGAAGGVVISDLWTRFLPSFFIGETLNLDGIWIGVLVVWVLGVLLIAQNRSRRLAVALTMYLLIPLILLTLVSTRMNVFLVRYVLAAIPALLIPFAVVLNRLFQGRIVYGVVILSAFFPLFHYWHGGVHKSSDWRALHTYLSPRLRAADRIIFTTSDPVNPSIDPAYGYYFRGQTPAYALPLHNQSVDQWLTENPMTGGATWFIPGGVRAGEIDQALRNRYQLITDRGTGWSFLVREYRARGIDPVEIQYPLTGTRIESGVLRGYRIDAVSTQLTVILYWETPPPPDLTLTVQLIGAPNPINGSPLWSQHDHPVSNLRDVYHLPLSAISPGKYTFQVAAYRPADPGKRLRWLTPDSASDHISLSNVNFPLIFMD